MSRVDQAPKNRWRIGDPMPDVRLPDSDGRIRTLQEIAGGDRLLVYVYRGCWCPYCLYQLGELRDRAENFRRLGIRIAALSVDSVEDAATTRRRGRLPFTLLCDPVREVVSAWGLLNGNDLQPAFPATFLRGIDGRLEFVLIDQGYSTGGAREVLTRCRAIAQGAPDSGVIKLGRPFPRTQHWLDAWTNELRVRWRRAFR